MARSNNSVFGVGWHEESGHFRAELMAGVMARSILLLFTKKLRDCIFTDEGPLRVLSQILGFDAHGEMGWRMLEVGPDFPIELLPVPYPWIDRDGRRPFPACDRFAPVSRGGELAGYLFRRREE